LIQTGKEWIMPPEELPEEMTLDEIVAYNVLRKREERRLSVATLAGLLGVKPHVVYDMQTSQRGRPQRAFRWQELAALCGALHTNLIELVLPPEGVQVAGIDEMFGTIADSDYEYRVETEPALTVYQEGPTGRDGLSWLLFAQPGDLWAPGETERFLSAEYERRVEDLEKKFDELSERLGQSKERTNGDD
jgi:hypothetical protein